MGCRRCFGLCAPSVRFSSPQSQSVPTPWAEEKREPLSEEIVVQVGGHQIATSWAGASTRANTSCSIPTCRVGRRRS